MPPQTTTQHQDTFGDLLGGLTMPGPPPMSSTDISTEPEILPTAIAAGKLYYHMSVILYRKSYI